MSEPNFQFRGIWLPAEVLYLYSEKKISCSDVLFLSIVEGLTEARGKGCWASNRYLSDKMGLHISTIKDTLRKLREMGLIVSEVEKGKRIIWTKWGMSTSEVVPDTVRGSTGDGTGRLLRSNRLDNIVDMGSLSDQNKTMATFKPKPKEEKTNLAHSMCADFLHTTIVEVRKIHRPWRKSQWADSFRLLQKDLQGEGQRMTRVLKWWAENVKMKGLPSILNADQFRKHFHWIETVYEKEVGKQVEITPEAKAIAKRVLMRGWPGRSRDQVEATIQISINNLRKIMEVRRDLSKIRTSDHSQHEFLKHLKTKFGDAANFVENWMYSLYGQYAHWKEWNQDLTSLALTVDNPRLNKMGKSWAAAYLGDTKKWEWFINKAKEGIRTL